MIQIKQIGTIPIRNIKLLRGSNSTTWKKHSNVDTMIELNNVLIGKSIHSKGIQKIEKVVHAKLYIDFHWRLQALQWSSRSWQNSSQFFQMINCRQLNNERQE